MSSQRIVAIALLAAGLSMGESAFAAPKEEPKAGSATTGRAPSPERAPAGGVERPTVDGRSGVGTPGAASSGDRPSKSRGGGIDRGAEMQRRQAPPSAPIGSQEPGASATRLDGMPPQRSALPKAAWQREPNGDAELRELTPPPGVDVEIDGTIARWSNGESWSCTCPLLKTLLQDPSVCGHETACSVKQEGNSIRCSGQCSISVTQKNGSCESSWAINCSWEEASRIRNQRELQGLFPDVAP